MKKKKNRGCETAAELAGFRHWGSSTESSLMTDGGIKLSGFHISL